MTLDPYSLDCPVCGREITVGEDDRCPICETDLAPLVRWRVHAARVYNGALEAWAAGDWPRAAALLETCREVAPKAAEPALLLGKVYARLGRTQEAGQALDQAEHLGAHPEQVASAREALERLPAASQERPMPADRSRLWQSVAGAVALLAVLLAGGAYWLGRAQAPTRSVEVPVTVLVMTTPSPRPETATPAPPPTETPSATAVPPTPTVTPNPTATPTQAPTATSTPPCIGLAGDVAAAWAEVPGHSWADLRIEADGCAVQVRGSAPTSYLLQRIVQAARRAGAETVDTSAVTLDLTYVVQPGDTLWSIADRLYGTPYRWSAIYEANEDRLSAPGLLSPGLTLRLPHGGSGE